MTKTQIHQLINSGLPADSGEGKLVETHISWVILTEQYVYKIKRPIKYSFLDFSTLEKRKYYCEREVELNKRLTDNIYLDVQPLREQVNKIIINRPTGEIVDYAVRMNKLEATKQMNILLSHHAVNPDDIDHLAKRIALFHKKAAIIYEKDYMDIKAKFDDLEAERTFLADHLDRKSAEIVAQAVSISGAFTEQHQSRLAERMKKGFFRDGHGDLHSRNIFLLPEPQAFDCIEFNDDFRQIDVLNDIAFLCMDLDAFKRQDLSALFFETYNNYFPAVENKTDKQLFIYYKSYRANIRAKVNSLRAKSAENDQERKKALSECRKYLLLMHNYLEAIKSA